MGMRKAWLVLPILGLGFFVLSGCGSNSNPTSPAATNTPTAVSTAIPTNSPATTPTLTETSTPFSTPTHTGTPTDSMTATPSLTATPSASPTSSATFTATGTPSASSTGTSSATSTPTATPTDSPTNSPTSTPSGTPTNSVTATPSGTSTDTATNSPTPSPTGTPTNSATVTNSSTPTLTATNTSTPTITSTPTNTPTPNATVCGTFTAFGNTSSSPDTYPSAAGLEPEMLLSSYTLTDTSTLWDLKFNLSTDSYPMTLQAGVFNADTGQLVINCAKQYVNTPPVMTWVQFNMPQPKTLVPGHYYLAVMLTDDQVGYPAPLLAGNSGSNNTIDVRSSAGFTATLSTSGASTLAGTLEAYADVCGAPPTPTPTFFATPCSTKDFLGYQADTLLGSISQGDLQYSAFTLAGPNSAILWDLQAAIQTYGTTSSTFQAGVYDQATGALVATSAQQAVSTNGATQWVRFDMSQPATLAPGNYLLCLWMPTSSVIQQLAYGQQGNNVNILASYTGFTSTFNSSGSFNYQNTLSLYAETCSINPTPTPASIPTRCPTPSALGDSSYPFDSDPNFARDDLRYTILNQPGPGSVTIFDLQCVMQNSYPGVPMTVVGGVYDQASGDLLGVSSPQVMDYTGGLQYVQVNLTYPVPLPPGNYILGIWNRNSTAGYIGMHTSGNNAYQISYFGGFTPVFNGSGSLQGSESVAIYGDTCP